MGKSEPTIHQENLRVLMTEVYKIVNGIAPPIMNSLFNFHANIIISETLQRPVKL